jgi:DNA helicase-2/ATP-dependent DNA helicase PcrA
MELKERYIAAKRRFLENEFGRMNDMQKKAVFQTEGPVLILAGAGSGKTTVLVNRTANLIRFGDAYQSEDMPLAVTEEDVQFLEGAASGSSRSGGDNDRERAENLISSYPAKPWQIMAITFTNKAAGELKTRLETMLGERGQDVWAATFHSSCARMLRRDSDRLGYERNFTIYDMDDCKRMIKDITSGLQLDEKTMPHKAVMSEISKAKESMLSPERYAAKAGSDFRLRKISDIYTAYQRRLREANAMDFDDLLFNTVKLLQENEDVLSYYHHKFRYIMVDEYQDTNHAQYLFIKLLSEKHRNLCVVGDDDQSIYKFRGATIENILSFEKQYPDALVIRLEQNYRSTGAILGAANGVISNNTERKSKSLWTDKGEGELIELYTAMSDRDEAAYIANTVTDNVAAGGKYADHAVLYRTNAQSNSVENYLARAGIPYRIIGGHRFYERKEIKDMLSYLCVINNPSDEIRLKRIINEPKRGIGARSIELAAEIAEQLSVSMFEVIETADRYQGLSRAALKLMEFAAMIKSLIDASNDPAVLLDGLLDMIIAKTGYKTALESDEKGQERWENIEELKSNLLKYQEEHGEETDIGEFLEEVALVADIDNYDDTADTVVLMTMHSAKGLEFPVVFIPGMEEGIFPGRQTMLMPEETEEERRLAYVGITRAKSKLHIIHAESRILYGTTVRNPLSRFASEIPSHLIHRTAAVKTPMQTAFEARKKGAGEENRYASSTKISGTSGAAGRSTSGAAGGGSLHMGDRVAHKIFGEGIITKAEPVGSDVLLEVDFDKVGVKKLMGGFAGLKKIN